MTEKSPVIRLDDRDNIVVARVPVEKGTEIKSEGITAQSDIPLGHKIATRPIKKGEPVCKYSTVIGYASRDVVPGTHMHNDTIAFGKVSRAYDFCADYRPVTLVPADRRMTFQGFVREDGGAGTRNCIAVVTASNCSATVVRKIAAHFTPEVMARYPNVDAVVPLITALGCGMEKGDTVPMNYLRRVLAGHIENPNIAGALVCALGCENNNIDDFFAKEGWTENSMLRKLTIQDFGAAKSVELGIKMVEEMLPAADRCRRETVSAEHLKIGLQCGGSDSFSGTSANPALGKAMDILVANGGTACLSETTELFSTEEIFVRRARTEEVARKLLGSLDWWLEYCRGKDSQINGKVTPGNNAGGLTNILEKALGSAKKGGSTPLNEVYGYAEKITQSGLVIMDAPSYDPASATAQFAGGCNLCIFTTGRGSCYGSQYFPTIKIASNTQLYERMRGDMDINAGSVIDGDRTLDEAAREIFDKMLRVASGEKTKSEAFGMGGDEFVPWAIGITG